MVRVTWEKLVKVEEAEVIRTGDEVRMVIGTTVCAGLDPLVGLEVRPESEDEPLSAPLFGLGALKGDEPAPFELEEGGAERGDEDVGDGSSDAGVEEGRNTEPLLVVHQRLLS